PRSSQCGATGDYTRTQIPTNPLPDELRHDLLGEDLQLPLDHGERRETLLNPPDQIARIAGLDHLGQLPFDIIHRAGIEIVRPLHRVQGPGDIPFLPWE